MITVKLFDRSVNSVFSRRNATGKTPEFCYDCTLKKDNMALIQERGYWKKFHERAIDRKRRRIKKREYRIKGKNKISSTTTIWTEERE